MLAYYVIPNQDQKDLPYCNLGNPLFNYYIVNDYNPLTAITSSCYFCEGTPTDNFTKCNLKTNVSFQSNTLIVLHVVTFIAMALNATKSLNSIWRDGPLIAIAPVYLGYITYVSTSWTEFILEPVHYFSERNPYILIKPSDWSWHLWQLLEVSVPLGCAVSGSLYFFLRYCFPDSFIITEWKIAISREYLNINTQDLLTVHIEEILDFSMFIVPFVLKFILGLFVLNGPIVEMSLAPLKNEFLDRYVWPTLVISTFSGVIYCIFYFVNFK